MNQGVCNSILTASSPIIVVMSYILYREKINVPQGLGIIMIVVSIIIISLSKEWIYIVVTTHDEEVNLKYLAEDSHFSRTISIFCSIAAAIFFATEALIVRYLGSFKVSGEVAGFFYLFFEGIFGTIGLIISSFAGYGIMDYELESALLVFIGGFSITAGVVLLNYSISIGSAGVCFSISSSNAAI
jgi:drug/metabolite transporter (DMT)-like permease